MAFKENKAFKLKAKAGKIISVVQIFDVFQAFFQNAPRHKGTGMTWQVAITNLLLRDTKLKLIVKKEKDVFVAFFDLELARRIKGLGMSEGSAVVDLLNQSGVEHYVHYGVKKFSDLAILKTG
jgi:hypothetical protein